MYFWNVELEFESVLQEQRKIIEKIQQSQQFLKFLLTFVA